MEKDNLNGLALLTQYLNIMLVAGTIFVALIMLAGYSYNFGYLNGFGLGPDELGFTFYDSVSGAFGVGVTFLGEIILHVSWVYYFLGFLALCMALGIAISFVLLIMGHGEEIFSNRFFKFTDKVVGEIQVWLIYIVVGLTFIFILPYLVVAKPYLMGTEQSKRRIEQYEEVQYECSKLQLAGYSCTSLKSHDRDKIETQGLLIVATDAVIAIRDREVNRIYNRSAEFMLEILPPEVKKSDKAKNSNSE